jgi:hypothetical protein
MNRCMRIGCAAAGLVMVSSLSLAHTSSWEGVGAESSPTVVTAEFVDLLDETGETVGAAEAEELFDAWPFAFEGKEPYKYRAPWFLMGVTTSALRRHTRNWLGAIVPEPVRRRMWHAFNVMHIVTSRTRMVTGVEPLSLQWSTDRGLPIERYYLAQFLEEWRSEIRGRCLEFQDGLYTRSYGGDHVSHVDILHHDGSNPQATIVADLSRPTDIPSESFDCIICTYVLQLVFELDVCVTELHRLLAPGGTLLVAVPNVAMSAMPLYSDTWRFTPKGLEALLARTFGGDNVTVRAYGNSLTTAGSLRGLVASEFTAKELAYHDPRFAVITCAGARKPGAGPQSPGAA